MTSAEFQEIELSASEGNSFSKIWLAILYRKGIRNDTFLVLRNSDKSKEYLESAKMDNYWLAKLMLNRLMIVREPVFLFLYILLSAVDFINYDKQVLISVLSKLFGFGLTVSKIFLKLALWVLIIAVACIILYLIFEGISILPVSVAIILGAVIIALAIRR